jgi:UPF0716 family protein affecting phage T7 exclusion
MAAAGFEATLLLHVSPWGRAIGHLPLVLLVLLGELLLLGVPLAVAGLRAALPRLRAGLRRGRAPGARERSAPPPDDA